MKNNESPTLDGWNPAEAWKTVATLSDLQDFLVRHHHPKRLRLSEGDFWRVFKLLPPSNRPLYTYEDEPKLQWFPCLKTNVECAAPKFISLELIDLSGAE